MIISMTWWFLFNMLNVLWKSMKFKWHAQMKKHELMIVILKCKTCVKNLMRLKMNNGSSIHSKDCIIQMSLFLYWLNMAIIIRVSHPEISNRVQSRSCHVSLIKLDIVALNLKSLISLYPCFSYDKWWNWFEFI